MTTKEKYELIDKTKINPKVLEILQNMEKSSKNFTDEAVNAKIDGALDKLIEGFRANKPEALRTLPEAKKEVKKEKEKAQKKNEGKDFSDKKDTDDKTGLPKKDTLEERKEIIKKESESEKEARDRARKELEKEKEKAKDEVESQIEKLNRLILEDPALRGFNTGTAATGGGRSTPIIDAERKALPRGSRVSHKGWKNQYGASDGGRKYWENRENRSDRKSPEYETGKPYLAKGGYMADGGELRNYKTFVEEYPDKNIYVRVKFAGSDKDVQKYIANESNKKRAIDFAKRLAEKNNGTYEGFKTYTYAKGGYMADGGKVDKRILEKVYEYYDIYKDGTNREHYNDFDNIEKVKEHIEKRTGMEVLKIKEIEIGRNYPDNMSHPYYHDDYEFELVKGQPLRVERMYGRPNYSGNVAYTNMIEVKNLWQMADGGYISSGKKLYHVSNNMSDKEFQEAYRKLSDREKDIYDELNEPLGENESVYFEVYDSNRNYGIIKFYKNGSRIFETLLMGNVKAGNRRYMSYFTKDDLKLSLNRDFDVVNEVDEDYVNDRLISYEKSKPSDIFVVKYPYPELAKTADTLTIIKGGEQVFDYDPITKDFTLVSIGLSYPDQIELDDFLEDSKGVSERQYTPELIKVIEVIKENEDISEIVNELKSKGLIQNYNYTMADGGEVETILVVPKYLKDEIEESINLGYDELVVGMISKNRKGVLLINDNYEVRGTYDIGLKNYIENIIEKHKTKKSKGGYMADGGEVDFSKKMAKMRSAYENLDMIVKTKIAMAIGIDNAVSIMDYDYIEHPFDLIKGAVRSGLLEIDEINGDLVGSAIQEAERIDEDYKDSGEGIGSSDITYFTKHVLDDAGYKTAFINNRLTRVDDDGNELVIDKYEMNF